LRCFLASSKIDWLGHDLCIPTGQRLSQIAIAQFQQEGLDVASLSQGGPNEALRFDNSDLGCHNPFEDKAFKGSATIRSIVVYATEIRPKAGARLRQGNFTPVAGQWGIGEAEFGGAINPLQLNVSKQHAVTAECAGGAKGSDGIDVVLSLFGWWSAAHGIGP
jgi:hypothetical protein